jgi:hypothetical protein
MARRDDRLARRNPHGHGQEEEREVDGERDRQRQEHRARQVVLRLTDLAADRRDQVEAL